jgi:glycine cleavage system H protein
MEYPDDLKYTEQHEWVRLEDGKVRVGITDFAQDALGDVVYIDVPEVGTEVSAGVPFGEVESTKSVSDVYAPVSGVVVERNGELVERPGLINDAPYGDGWMIVIEPFDDAELADLLDAEQYRQLTAPEAGEG